MSMEGNVDYLSTRLGKDIRAGHYVIYFSEGNVKTSLKAGIKKYIYRVRHYIDADNAQLQNIGNLTYFTTDVKYFVNISHYIELGILTEEYIIKSSYETYMKTLEPYKLGLGSFSVEEATTWNEDSTLVKYIPDPTAIKLSGINEYLDKRKKNVRTDKIVDANVIAAKNATKITAGKTLNSIVRKKVSPMLPLMVRGYADTKLGEVVIANVFKFAVDNFAANNKNAALASEAMLEAAMLDFFSTFNVDELITEALGDFDFNTLTESE